MRYGVVIVFYNPDNAALKQLEVYMKVFESILVVDNSEQEIGYVIKKLRDYPKICYKSMQGNQGMSAALNEGFVWGRKMNLDFLLTMDQDSVYTEKNITTMIQYIESNYEEDVGIYVANFSKLYTDKSSGRLVAGKPAIGLKEIKEVNMCLTSSSFFNMRAITKIFPVEDYFISYIDNIISMDLKRNHYRLIRVGASYFEQQVGEAVPYSKLNELLRIVHHREERYYYMVRNNCYFRKKFKSDKQCLKISYLLLWRLLFNILIGESNKINKLKACWSGWKDFKGNVYGKIPEESVIWRNRILRR